MYLSLPICAILAVVAIDGGSDLYPPVRHATATRFYGLEGKLDEEVLASLLEEHALEAVAGPVEPDGRPGRAFLALAAPAEWSSKDVTRVLRKAKVRVEELACVCFDGREGKAELPSLGPGLSTRDHVLGISGDLRWYEWSGAWSQFFSAPRKLDSTKLEERYRRLYEPFGGGRVGELARDSFSWALVSPLDERGARKAQKAIAKLPGIEEVHIDVEGAALSVTVVLDGLSVSAPLVPVGGEALLRPRFYTNPLLDILEEHAIDVQSD